jgi:hypothetical protein
MVASRIYSLFGSGVSTVAHNALKEKKLIIKIQGFIFYPSIYFNSS